ncbi:hypothetical protein [Fluviispira multicolorata]|uniref:Uncharacterized protein n=1 Tax=Fluviispira multicolorata TaxID=2654512 RepID=A0A833JAU0_9BACT|nr:hypothetical protein [Fluviispira multicolorata]KAB8028498.1 hypothetical protein GCL57_12295 [Fluviispira multicolorata]
MKMLNYKAILILVAIGFSFPAFSDEAHILCVDKKYQFNWLPQVIYGSWKKMDIFFSDTHYFIFAGGAHDYLRLKIQCSKLYGHDFSYLLAVKEIGDNWKSVAVSENFIIPAPWDDPRYILEFVSIIKIPKYF